MLRLIKITLLLSTLFLISCIDGEEEITILQDGSGTVEVNYLVPKQALSQEDANLLKKFLTGVQERHPSLHLAKFEIKSQPPRLFGPTMQTLSMQIDFKSATKLPEIYKIELARLESTKPDSKPNPELVILIAKSKAILGTFNIQIDGLAVDFDRTIDLEPLFEGRIKNGNIFGNSTFRYIINIPTPAGENNATSITNDRKKLQWTVNLKESFGKPIRMKLKIPAPTWLKITIIAVPLIILATLFIIIRLIIKKRRKKHPKPTYEPTGL